MNENSDGLIAGHGEKNYIVKGNCLAQKQILGWYKGKDLQ